MYQLAKQNLLSQENKSCIVYDYQFIQYEFLKIAF